jgi:acetyltransferase
MPRRAMTVPRFNPAGRFNPDALFRPRAVAVIGAGTETGAQIAANLNLGKFQGTIQAVDSVKALSSTPDLAILAVPPPAIGPALQALAAAGCHAAVVPGPADGLAEAARRTGVRVLGPHSLGLAAPSIGLNASLAHIPPPPGRLGLVSQSATLCRTVIDWAGPNGVGFSHVIGIGGNADIGFSPVLDWLSRDPDTGAILLDIHRLKDRRAFLSAARAAARLRPVVAIRAGGYLLDDGLGEAELAFEAALRRAGVLGVRHLEDLLAAAETLSRARPARGEALAIVTNSIGAGRLAADAALLDGLLLADLTGGRHGIVHVPPETGGLLAATAGVAAAAPGVGGVLVVHAPAGAGDVASIDALVAAAPRVSAPLLVCAMGETTGAPHRAALVKAGLAAFATPAQAVRGFQHLVRDRRNRAAARELPPGTVLSLAPDRMAVSRLFARVRRAGRLALFQDEALDILTAYGIPTVPTRCVADAEDALEAALLLGFPVVVKLRQAVAPRERPPSAVALDLHDADEVRTAARLLVARQMRGGRAALGAGILVQRQVARAREFGVRVSDDPTFGPVFAFGPGGTGADGSQDLAMDLPPLNLPLAHGLIGRCRAGAMLGRVLRDMPAGDEPAAAEVLVRISQLIVDWPEIGELMLPALFVDTAGVTAADAWLRLRGVDEPPAVLAIAPYPSELVQRWPGGSESFIIRPIRPEDATQHGVFFRRLPALDVRYRFFSAVRELSQEQMARLTQVDYDREMALIAVREATGETVGAARLVREQDGRSGEFAVIVQPDVKGQGLASHLVQRLFDWARQRGVAEVVGQVLAENAPMLAFVRHLGFSLRRMPEEPDVIEVRLEL